MRDTKAAARVAAFAASLWLTASAGAAAEPALRFAVVAAPSGAPSSPPQIYFLERAVSGEGPWIARSDQPWLSVTPAAGRGPGRLTVAVNGNPASSSGTVTVEIASPGAPRIVRIGVSVSRLTEDRPPAGVIDAPGNPIVLDEPVSLLGWAIDDVSPVDVKICLRPGCTVIASAVFADGGRPDIAAANPSAPFGDRVAWSVVLDPSMLPDSQRRASIAVVAVDGAGHEKVLGDRQIIHPEMPAPWGFPDPHPILRKLALVGAVAALLHVLLWRRLKQPADEAPAGEAAKAPRIADYGVPIAAMALLVALNAGALTRSLGYDEMVTASSFVVDQPISRAAWGMVVLNNHPGYSLGAWPLVKLLGPSEWVLRILALVYGCGAVYALWAFGRRACDRWTGAAACLLLAASPFFGEYSVSARGYTGFAFCMLVSSCAFLDLLNAPSRRTAVTHAVAGALGGWFHLYGIWILAIQGAIFAGVVLLRPRRDVRSAAGLRQLWWSLPAAVAGFLLLYAPILGDVISITLIRGHAPFRPGLLEELLTGLTVEPWRIAATLGVMALAGLALLRRIPALLASAILLVPFGAVWFVLKPADVSARYFAFTLPWLMLGVGSLLAAALRVAWLGTGIGRRFAGAMGAIAVAAVLSVVVTGWLRGPRNQPDDFRARLARAAHFDPSHSFVLGDGDMFDYYLGKPLGKLHSRAELDAVMRRDSSPLQVVYSDVPWNNDLERETASVLAQRCANEQPSPFLIVFRCL